MSISRKNWSTLSTLTRQWTVEDEEEVEREKRRKKTRGFSTTTDPDESSTEETEPHSSGGADADDLNGVSSGGQDQMDFVEMLRVRDERRRRRHMETLMKQKEEEEGDRGEKHKPQKEKLADLIGEKDNQENHDNVQHFNPPQPSTNSKKTVKPDQNKTGRISQSASPKTPPASSRQFVSSLSISFDKSPSSPPPARSRVISPMRSMSPPLQSLEAEPPYSSTHSATLSPTTNGDASREENKVQSHFEPAKKSAFTRQSSRTVSFRMMRKKEEEKEEDSKPLRRSTSVRYAVKNPESEKTNNEEDVRQTPFQRNSRQRLSSRSIQEKMERLAQASQKWEISKSPPVPTTVCLMDEVSRKRELFEKDNSAGFSRQDQIHSSGLSDRVNRWFQSKTSHTRSVRERDVTSCSHIQGMPLEVCVGPTGFNQRKNLRHVSMSSKKSLFEK